MRAVVAQEFGDPQGMEVVTVPAPTPAPGQILIVTDAIGVGGVDAMIRRGALGAAFPAGTILGGEVAGRVSAVGDGVDGSWVGRQVWAATGTTGGYAEAAVANVSDVTPIPEGLTPVDAVALGSAATVAHFALEHAHFKAGESVLVRGAAGSIGIATVELAARAGASAVAVTTSSPERARRLGDLGATHVLDRSGVGTPDSPAMFDVIIDIVGGPELPVFLDRLAPNGRLVLVGAVAGFPPDDFGMQLMRTFQQSRSFAAFSLASIPAERRAAGRSAQFEAAVRGELTPVVQAVLPLADAPDAHRQMDAGEVFGRFVLVP